MTAVRCQPRRGTVLSALSAAPQTATAKTNAIEKRNIGGSEGCFRYGRVYRSARRAAASGFGHLKTWLKPLINGPFIFRHCEEQSDEAIHLFVAMDCFAEPMIGRAFARPVGSQ
jgi:hypothetical protein